MVETSQVVLGYLGCLSLRLIALPDFGHQQVQNEGHILLEGFSKSLAEIVAEKTLVQ